MDNIYTILMSGKIEGLVLLPTPHSPIMDRLFDANTHPAIPSQTLRVSTSSLN